MFLSTIQLMRALTLTTIKHLMQNTAELTERWRKQIKLSALSSLTERLRVQENKTRVLKAKAKRYTRCFKVSE
jgi:hypothetical protein